MKKTLASVLCMLLIATLFVGAGSAESAATVLDGITLTRDYEGTTLNLIWGETIAYSLKLKELIPEFEAATGIKIETEALSDVEISRKLAIDSAAGDDTLDVFYFRPAQETKAFVNNGWIRDISSFMDDAEYDFADISKESLNVTSLNGKLYGIPITVEHTMLFYNEDLFKAAGLERAPETLDELVEYCEKLSNLGEGKYALCMRGQGTAAVIAFAPFLYAFGGKFIDENNQACFNSPEALKAFEYYATLITKYCPEGSTAYTTAEASAMMRLGNCAMYIDYDSHYAFIVADETSNIAESCRYAKFPSGDAGFTPCGPVAWAMGISENSQNPEAAEMFVKWATSKDVFIKAAELGQISGRVSATAPDVLFKNFSEQYATVVSETTPYANPYDRPFIVAGTEARQIVGEVIDYANAGHTGDDLKAFADDACARVQALIDAE